MRTLRPLAFLALVLTLCVLPKLTAEEKLDLPGAKPTPLPASIPNAAPVVPSGSPAYPWEEGNEAGVRYLLSQRCGEMDFDGIAFDQLIDHLRDLTRVNIVVNWSALETAAIDREREVSLKLRADTVTFGMVLRLILEEVGGGEVELDYAVRDGVITISTKEDLCRATIVVFYNVSDLVRAAELKRYYDPLARLVDMLQTTVDPESWREAGGNTGAINNFTDILVVTQTAKAHEMIWDTLQTLRLQMGLPIHGVHAPAVVR